MKYYNDLLEAEEEQNALLYLDALDTIFSKMEYVKYESYERMIFYKVHDEVTYSQKFNEILNIDDVENNDIVKQIGFLPFKVDMISYNYTEAINRHDYTYKILGISYCETKNKCSDIVKDSEDLIIIEDYDKNHVKTFLREMTFTSSLIHENEISIIRRLSGDINMTIEGIGSPYEVKTTFFEEIGLFEMFYEMQTGYFDYEKPDGFNLRDYRNKN